MVIFYHLSYAMKSIVQYLIAGFFLLLVFSPFLLAVYRHGGIKRYYDWKKKRRQRYFEYITHLL